MGNDDRSSLDELEAKLRKARAAREPTDRQADGAAGMASTTRQAGVAYRIFVELLAGILVGAGLGWFLDRILGTAPWFLLGLLVFGIVAGFVNTIRTAQRMAADMNAKPKADKGDQ
jgi:ATP synthase protein I